MSKVNPTRLAGLLRYRADLLEWLDTDLDVKEYDCLIVENVNQGTIRDELGPNGGSRFGWEGGFLMPLDYFKPMLTAQLALVNAELKSLGIEPEDEPAESPADSKGKD